jgi:hypothetical protein
VLWAQWASINADVSSTRLACVIDPEALVLGSVALGNGERRFLDMVVWLAKSLSHLLSVQRVRTLSVAFPNGLEHAGWFAYWAVELAGDRRWDSLAQPPASGMTRQGKGPEKVQLSSPAALMLRLRSGFGVGVKADLLTYLLTIQGAPQTAMDIAAATGYTDKTIRVAARELFMAGFAEESSEYPVRYSTSPQFSSSFVRLLYHEDKVAIPKWCHWAQVLPFLLRIAHWRDDVLLDEYLAASAARDLYEEFDTTFRALGMRMPRPESHKGSAYLPVFAEFTSQLDTWIEEEEADVSATR